MSDLTSILTADGTRDAIVADLEKLTNDTIQGLSGLSGAAIKTAFRGAVGSRPDLLRRALTRFLPDIAAALQPSWDAAATNGQRYADYLAANEGPVTAQLLAVADEKVNQLNNAAVRQVYGVARNKAEVIASSALPELGAIIEKYAS